MNANIKSTIQTMTNFPKSADELHEQAADANLLEYWKATYRKPFPDTPAIAHVWHWMDMKRLLQATTKFIPIDQAKRRGLILTNPGMSEPYATPTIFADIQLLAPDEKAPVHRHTSSASRLFMEGAPGGYTVVQGEKCYMGPGDLVINPAWDWHDHGNESGGEITYLNVLDIPLVERLGAVFYDVDYKKIHDQDEHFQSVTKPDGWSSRLFRSGGLLPRSRKLQPASNFRTHQLIYKWDATRERLYDLKDVVADDYDDIILEYVNPETGTSVTPTMKFYVQMVRRGANLRKHRRTASSVSWVAEGSGTIELDKGSLHVEHNDVFVLPSWDWFRVSASSEDLIILSVSDEPAVRSAGVFREEGVGPNGDNVMLDALV